MVAINNSIETATRCKKVLIWLLIAYMLTVWLPVIICAWLSFRPDESSKFNIVLSNTLFSCSLSSPFILALPFAIFVHKVTRILKGSNYGLWIFVPLSLIPFVGWFGYVVLWKEAAGILGEDMEAIPRTLRMRRCKCGGLMCVVSATQSRKLISGRATGYTLCFKCRQCARQIKVPSGLKMIKIFLGMAGIAWFLYMGIFHGAKTIDNEERFLRVVFGMISATFGYFFFKALLNRWNYPIVKPENTR